jgi:hypothetical protein
MKDQHCYAVCPAGELADKELLRIEEARSVFQRAGG